MKKKLTVKKKKTVKKNKIKNNLIRKKKRKKSLKKQKGGAGFIKKLLNFNNKKDTAQENIDIFNKSSEIIIHRVKYLKTNNQDIYTATKKEVLSPKKDVFGVDEPEPIEFNPYLGTRISELKFTGKISEKNCDDPFRNPNICRSAIKNVEDEDNSILRKSKEMKNKINTYIDNWSNHISNLIEYINIIKKDLENIKNNNLKSNHITDSLLKLTEERRTNGLISSHILNEINNISDPNRIDFSSELTDKYIYKIIKKYIDTEFNISKTPISLEEMNLQSDILGKKKQEILQAEPEKKDVTNENVIEENDKTIQSGINSEKIVDNDSPSTPINQQNIVESNSIPNNSENVTKQMEVSMNDNSEVNNLGGENNQNIPNLNNGINSNTSSENRLS